MQRDLEPKLGVSGDLAHIADWAGRHLGRVLRIAGLLHLASRKTAAEPIDLDTFDRAQEIGEFLMAHGRGALEEPDTGTLRARHVLEGWEKETISVRDLHKHVFHGRGKVDAARRLAHQLVEEGLLVLVIPPRVKGRGGQPSPTYQINRSNL